VIAECNWRYLPQEPLSQGTTRKRREGGWREEGRGSKEEEEEEEVAVAGRGSEDEPHSWPRRKDMGSL